MNIQDSREKKYVKDVLPSQIFEYEGDYYIKIYCYDGNGNYQQVNLQTGEASRMYDYNEVYVVPHTLHVG